LNFARLNHILIPGTKEGRDHFRESLPSRICLQPLASLYFSLTDTGRGLLLLTAIAMLLGLDVIRGENYILWAFTFSLLLGSLLFRFLLKLADTRIEVGGPRRVVVGADAQFQVTIFNEGDRILHSLQILRPFLPWDGHWISGDGSMAELQPGERRTLEIRGRFIERGYHHIDSFSVAGLMPLGLARGPAIASSGTRFIVVPRIARVAEILLTQSARHQVGGVALASRTGESMELAGLRDYESGDRIRDLHARSWARIGEPQVRVYQQEYFLRVGVVLDTDAEYADETLLESLVSLAAGALLHLIRSESLVDLFLPDDGEHPLAINRGLGSFDRALDGLAEVKLAAPFKGGTPSRALHPDFSSLSALLFITPAWDETRNQWMERIRSNGVNCRAIVVSDTPPPTSPGAARIRHLEPEHVEAACLGQTGLVL
jgi:uncharacterized protein (DUF58 family)